MWICCVCCVCSSTAGHSLFTLHLNFEFIFIFMCARANGFGLYFVAFFIYSFNLTACGTTRLAFGANTTSIFFSFFLSFFEFVSFCKQNRIYRARALARSRFPQRSRAHINPWMNEVFIFIHCERDVNKNELNVMKKAKEEKTRANPKWKLFFGWLINHIHVNLGEARWKTARAAKCAHVRMM